jgi:predicted AAA+ superfamily ATPase
LCKIQRSGIRYPAERPDKAQNHLGKCQQIISSLLTAYQDDFAKYKRNASVQHLQETFQSIALQAGGKFKYTNISSASSVHEAKTALAFLLKAGLAHQVFHTSARGLPLGAQIKPNKFKVILLDAGVHQRALGLDLSENLLADDAELINKGNLAELYAGLEFLSNSPQNIRSQLHYWHREARGSNAEVDYILQWRGKVLPVEVKSGKQGKMKSLRFFLEERNLELGVRLSLDNISEYDKIWTLPIYLAGELIRKGNA